MFQVDLDEQDGALSPELKRAVAALELQMGRLFLSALVGLRGDVL